ncbi:Oidioi.mRNA.OKI2018_I69.chr2.g5056.t1.cds [Oikopleura dioica]|uniref:Inositol-pentakisphosphate 2-kinase n=1 Tax=Oikopleura dioica TaxID=34765 RepID=A0ABN7T3K8_OIKDI|nr:Oidioi.mRNA.OKI2018_I69.chr2.g5056.t1.cds [Oikopleura dioica]
MQWDEKDWEYRAEGGKHLVVVNHSLHKILRFIKVPVGVERNLNDERIQIERRLNYEKYAPLLSEFEIHTDSGELVFLSADFCDPLFARIDDDRPNARKLLEVPRGPRYAVLQDDFTQSNSSDSSFAIEIKPKCAYVQPNLRSCQFCLMQLEHLLDGRDVNSRCFYCSADFFSSDLSRKKFAFKNLLENPLKDLRFFKDGELIFSMDTLEYVGKSGNDRFHEKMDDLCGFTDALEKIIEDLCNSLGSREFFSDNQKRPFSDPFDPQRKRFKPLES